MTVHELIALLETAPDPDCEVRVEYGGFELDIRRVTLTTREEQGWPSVPAGVATDARYLLIDIGM